MSWASSFEFASCMQYSFCRSRTQCIGPDPGCISLNQICFFEVNNLALTRIDKTLGTEGRTPWADPPLIYETRVGTSCHLKKKANRNIWTLSHISLCQTSCIIPFASTRTILCIAWNHYCLIRSTATSYHRDFWTHECIPPLRFNVLSRHLIDDTFPHQYCQRFY